MFNPFLETAQARGRGNQIPCKDSHQYRYLFDVSKSVSPSDGGTHPAGGTGLTTPEERVSPVSCSGSTHFPMMTDVLLLGVVLSIRYTEITQASLPYTARSYRITTPRNDTWSCKRLSYQLEPHLKPIYLLFHGTKKEGQKGHGI